MKIALKKQVALTALLASVAGSSVAQKQDLTMTHFVEVKGGGMHLSADGGSKFSPTVGFAYGIMSPVIGARLQVNGWEAGGGSYDTWKYVLGDLDLLVNLTNLTCKGSSHPLNVFLVGGFGLSNTWDREGVSSYSSVDHSWSSSFRGGLRLETDITKMLGLSIEVDANNMNHHFTGNASNTGNWAYTAQIGVSYRFGRKYKAVSEIVKADPQVPMTRYQMMMAQLNERMVAWSKRMPNESLEEYQLRVNDQTRAAQEEKLKYEISTQMAEAMLDEFDVSVGGYNPNLQKLTVHVQSMPDIFLDVAESDAAAFYKGEKGLKLNNRKYILNPDDTFELVYAEAKLPAQNKPFVFDNLKHESLTYIKEDDHFITADVYRKSVLEETSLTAMQEDITSLAKQDNVISDKTHISVSAKANPAVGANGKRTLNYNVGFTYEVEEKFSIRDDFKPGRYKTNESNAAMLTLKVMKKAFDTDFAKYLAEGKRVKIKITGTADAAPINRALAYDGTYGEYDNKVVYINNAKSSISLNKKDGIATNEQLAFARALGVQHTIEKEIPALAKTNHEYEYYIEVSKEKGSQFRRINVEYIFEDAF